MGPDTWIQLIIVLSCFGVIGYSGYVYSEHPKLLKYTNCNHVTILTIVYVALCSFVGKALLFDLCGCRKTLIFIVLILATITFDIYYSVRLFTLGSECETHFKVNYHKFWILIILDEVHIFLSLILVITLAIVRHRMVRDGRRIHDGL